jgi:hypothetical protein
MLADHRGRAASLGRSRQISRVDGRDEHDERMVPRGVDPLCELDPAHVGHANVDERQVRRVAFDSGQGVGGRRYLPRRLESGRCVNQIARNLEKGSVIVDSQDLHH